MVLNLCVSLLKFHRLLFDSITHCAHGLNSFLLFIVVLKNSVNNQRSEIPFGFYTLVYVCYILFIVFTRFIFYITVYDV